jgi:hypothetical protein
MSRVTDQKIIEKVLVDYMYEYGDYEESDNKFFDEKEEIFSSVITELYNRINK